MVGGKGGLSKRTFALKVSTNYDEDVFPFLKKNICLIDLGSVHTEAYESIICTVVVVRSRSYFPASSKN